MTRLCAAQLITRLLNAHEAWLDRGSHSEDPEYEPMVRAELRDVRNEVMTALTLDAPKLRDDFHGVPPA